MFRAIRSLRMHFSSLPYLVKPVSVSKQNVFIETYGCQMNFNDSEIVLGILKNSSYARVMDINDADVILVMTCAIRENAENKIWHRLRDFRELKKMNKKLKVGVLGCMAERLKKRLIEEEKSVDVVCGPDAYRDLPRLLADVDQGQTGINVLLSLEETYADVSPVRLTNNSLSAFVSIMRGCDNMCSYCIVPFTRGKERSRPTPSIVNEVKELEKAGVKEITLLGQNVNSYRDLTLQPKIETGLAKGFQTIYKDKVGGLRFIELLDAVSSAAPNVRFRFTSPHPKDFPVELVQLIRSGPNICNQIHLPAQSGSTTVLERMRRGYSRESYIDLVRQIRDIIPDVTLSSDFITGFCGETEEEHMETISLLEEVKFEKAYMFAYSMREKTNAHRTMEDDVPEAVKQRRLTEIIDTFRRESQIKHSKLIGTFQTVLIENQSTKHPGMMIGRSDGNHKVLLNRYPEKGSELFPGEFHECIVDSVKGATLYARKLFE